MFLYRFSWYVGVVIWVIGIPIGLDPLIINRLLAEKPSTFRRKEGGGSAKPHPRASRIGHLKPHPRASRGSLPHLGEGYNCWNPLGGSGIIARG